MAITENTVVEQLTVDCKRKRKEDGKFCLVIHDKQGQIFPTAANVDTPAANRMLLADSRKELVAYAEDNGIEIQQGARP